ncbi:hypothetical protein NL676_015637 [Syzygium grande]|nr:hypothetical protein NL676_015637 [Syzygium grande]
MDVFTDWPAQLEDGPDRAVRVGPEQQTRPERWKMSRPHGATPELETAPRTCPAPGKRGPPRDRETVKTRGHFSFACYFTAKQTPAFR